MRPTIFRVSAFLLSFSIAVVACYLVLNLASDPPLPPIPNQPELCKDQRNVFVVISIPNDQEFYIDKQRVEPSQIASRISRFFSFAPDFNRVVYIKSGSTVRYKTLDIVIRQAKQVPISRIEFVLDKKKTIPN
jgi:biopolymer transport protein ExbD